MKTLSDYRSLARTELRGHWGEAAMFTFVYYIITGMLCGIFACTNFVLEGSGGLWAIILLPMCWSFEVAFLALHRGKDQDPFDIWHLVDGYRNGQFLRILGTTLLSGVYVFLWSLLLIIPGIIKGLSYAMTPFILRDYPYLKYNNAIETSMDMMYGHKWDLFWLMLSFIGWAIVGLFTFGIGYFWLSPYIQATLVNFYEDVKRSYEGEIKEAEEYETVEEAEVVTEEAKPTADPVSEPKEESTVYGKDERSEHDHYQK